MCEGEGVCVYVCECVCVCVCIHVCVYVYVCVYPCVCVCIKSIADLPVPVPGTPPRPPRRAAPPLMGGASALPGL